MGEQTGREDLAVGIAELRAEVRGLNSRFDGFGDLIDAKLAPLQRWMDGQQTTCTSHETRITKLEGKMASVGPAVEKHDARLVRVEHVTQNVTWIGGAIWLVVSGLLVALARRVFGG